MWINDNSIDFGIIPPTSYFSGCDRSYVMSPFPLTLLKVAVFWVVAPSQIPTVGTPRPSVIALDGDWETNGSWGIHSHTSSLSALTKEDQRSPNVLLTMGELIIYDKAGPSPKKGSIYPMPPNFENSIYIVDKSPCLVPGAHFSMPHSTSSTSSVYHHNHHQAVTHALQ